MKLLGMIIVNFGAKCRLLIIYSAFVKYLRKNGKYNKVVRQLFIYFKNAYDSARREVSHNTLVEFGILVKLVRLIKMCLNETCSKVRVGKHSPEMFPVRNGLKQGDALLTG